MQSVELNLVSNFSIIQVCVCLEFWDIYRNQLQSLNQNQDLDSYACLEVFQVTVGLECLSYLEEASRKAAYV